MNTVLMTHILAEGSMGMADIANEALLLFVGTGVGVVLNLYIPGTETAIRSAQGEIEETFISLLSRMASELGTPGENGGAAGRPRVSGPGTGIGAGIGAGRTQSLRGDGEQSFGGHTLLSCLYGAEEEPVCHPLQDAGLLFKNGVHTGPGAGGGGPASICKRFLPRKEQCPGIAG